MTGSVLWYATRGAGAVSLLLLTAVVVLGVLAALRWRTAAWPRFLTAALHGNLALLAVVFLALHILTAVVDPFTALGWKAAVIPFASSYRTFWLGLGVVAVDLLVAVVITSLVRFLLGYRAWRAAHWVAYACWPIALAHGLGAGSDGGRPWLLAIEVGCGAVVLVAIAVRLAVRPVPGTGGAPPSAGPGGARQSDGAALP
jgi:predicted ferric reductase